MTDQDFVDSIRIASPCSARWEDMDGDDRARFCGQCRKHVYNFSAMTQAEVAALIREKEGRLCGRFYQRADGRMLTADCPVAVHRRCSRLARLAGSMATAILVFFGGRAWLRSEETLRPGKLPPRGGVSTNDPRAIMGDIAIEPPKPIKLEGNRPIMGKVSAICVTPPSTNAATSVVPKDAIRK